MATPEAELTPEEREIRLLQRGPELKWHEKVKNTMLCRGDPNAPPLTCKEWCIDCLKPEQPVETGPGEPAREQWGNRCTFFVTTLGMSVGLGQVWRFPTLCHKMGGAPFLIMYSIMVMMIGNALYFFEIANGQYTAKNPLRVYDKVPIFQGLGHSMIVYSSLFCIYYNHMVSFALIYLFSTFRARLPWSNCPDDEVNGMLCVPKSEDAGVICNGKKISAETWEKFCEAYEEKNNECCRALGSSCKNNLAIDKKIYCGTSKEPASSYFWKKTVNNLYVEGDPDYGYLGAISWSLLGTYFFAWLLNYLALYKGLKSMGCIMYVMVPLPYVVLIIMFAATIGKEGALDGLKDFFVPSDLSPFLKLNTWRVATEQAFYSLGVSMGPLVTFGSYNEFSSPSHKDATLICVCIIVTSVLCASVIFATLGFLEHTGNVAMDTVQGGPSLVFIIYPECIDLLPASHFFAIVFYLMIINLGSSTVSAIIETVSSVCYDLWPDTRKYKHIVNIFILLSCFIFGLPITLRGGLNIYDAFDIYSAGLTLIPICALELVCVIYIYGIGVFCEDIAFMVGYYPGRYYRYQWLVGPFILFAIYILGVVDMPSNDWKTWNKILGWCLFAIVMLPILIMMVIRVIEYAKEDDLKNCIKPRPDHGPPTEQLKRFRALFVSNREIF